MKYTADNKTLGRGMRNPDITDEYMERHLAHSIIQEMPIEDLKRVMCFERIDPDDEKCWQDAKNEARKGLESKLYMLRECDMRGEIRYIVTFHSPKMSRGEAITQLEEKSSAVAHSVAKSLAHDGDPHELLIQLVEIIESQQEQMEKFAVMAPMPHIVVDHSKFPPKI